MTTGGRGTHTSADLASPTQPPEAVDVGPPVGAKSRGWAAREVKGTWLKWVVTAQVVSFLLFFYPFLSLFFFFIFKLLNS
jgi:hypothetical protein